MDASWSDRSRPHRSGPGAGAAGGPADSARTASRRTRSTGQDEPRRTVRLVEPTTSRLRVLRARVPRTSRRAVIEASNRQAAAAPDISFRSTGTDGWRDRHGPSPSRRACSNAAPPGWYLGWELFVAPPACTTTRWLAWRCASAKATVTARAPATRSSRPSTTGPPSAGTRPCRQRTTATGQGASSQTFSAAACSSTSSSRLPPVIPTTSNCAPAPASARDRGIGPLSRSVTTGRSGAARPATVCATVRIELGSALAGGVAVGVRGCVHDPERRAASTGLPARPAHGTQSRLGPVHPDHDRCRTLLVHVVLQPRSTRLSVGCGPGLQEPRAVIARSRVPPNHGIGPPGGAEAADRFARVVGPVTSSAMDGQRWPVRAGPSPWASCRVATVRETGGAPPWCRR